MEQQRNLLFILLLLAGMFLFWDWNSDKVQQAQKDEFIAEQTIINSESDLSADNVIRLKSDNLDLAINLKGGDIVDAKLLKIKQEQDKDDPFHLLMTNGAFLYQAQSGLAGRDGIDNQERPLYSTDAKEFILQDGEDNVSAVLSLEKDGVSYKKIFSLDRDSYVVNVSYEIDNKSDKDLSLAFYGQLKQTENDEFLKKDTSFGMVASAYRGAAYSTQEKNYEKVSFGDMTSGDKLKESTKNGWVSMIQHYFVTAWIGDNTDNVIYTSRAAQDTQGIIGIRTQSVNVAQGQKETLKANLWIGPKDQDLMEQAAPHLELTVDYGWLWFISVPLFKLLTWIHSFIGNWGFAIIVLTLVVRGVMFPLTKAQYSSMAKMRLLQPKLTELRDRYKDDRQKIGQETMKLYKENHVNPLGGCLPMIIQMPIFIALYWTLMESTELRQSSFILWITDLSVKDPYFVLPLIYGVSMFFLQKMSPNTMTDPMQRKIFMAMPFVFTLMFCTFPAGLTLYWCVSNCFTIFQQFIIFRSLDKKGLGMKPTKAK